MSKCLAFLLLLLQFRAHVEGATAQDVSPLTQAPEITLHSSSHLVLVDVVARNRKNGLPDKSLKQSDFEILDNGRPVSITTFDSGASFTTRPLAVWFVVQCNMNGWENQGSGLFAGQISLFQPALTNLEKQDAVAVAHWCDNGDSRLDLLPASDVDRAMKTLETVLQPMPSPDGHGRAGELALQRTLQLIVDSTRSMTPEPLPVLIFLYGDYSAMPKAEADHFIDQLLETSAIAFGLKDRRSPGMWRFPGEQREIAHYIAIETGGEYLLVTPETYAKGLSEILQQLHFRYELGFKPESLDGKRHTLTVELASSAKRQHKGLRLKCRTAYVPVRPGA